MCIKPLTLFVLSRREFSHWKVNSLVTEKRDFFKAPLPLAPEFLRNLRLLGRRPSLQQIHENLIKKYGTHFLVSATLGGKPIFHEIYVKGEFKQLSGMSDHFFEVFHIFNLFFLPSLTHLKWSYSVTNES